MLNGADYKFVFGSNLLRNKLSLRFRQWDINLFNSRKLGPSILIGVGWHKENTRINEYTKNVYRNILSKSYIHSVRDEYTKNVLGSIGIENCINTGCPTLWNLTPNHCLKINNSKSEDVIFTLTDYKKNHVLDKKIFKILKSNYKNVYLWLQGYGDYQYSLDLGIQNEVIIIPPDLNEYNKILENEDVEYIGTRLHGGIRSLQKQRRTLILAVDERAKEIKHDFNIPVVAREEVDILEELINSKRSTKLDIPFERIKEWKNQFQV
jgi:polysaccharide pyruvyl transferase WcaK-like protein